MERPGTVDVTAEIAELRQRLYDLAKQVAAEHVAEEIPEGDLDVVFGRVGPHAAAFLREHVEEVVQMARLTPVPESPPWVAGLLNLRGEILPVIDVWSRCQRHDRQQELTDLIVICRTDGRMVGLVVQEVGIVHSVKRETFRPPPADVPLAPYLLGVLEADGAPALLWSVRRLVATSDLPEELP